MPIDFHDHDNANTYATRSADEGWLEQMRSLFGGDVPESVVDIGCGGGIYSRAWRELGASRVVGLDSSAQMIEDAKQASDDSAVQFSIADACSTGLDNESVDVAFSRAVVHHLDDHASAMKEAYRVVSRGGTVIVQDRTIEDVMQPTTPQHFRGHFFDEYPRLLELERKRRLGTEEFSNTIHAAGFETPEVHTFWETRRIYQNPDDLRSDLLARTGRSILHELSDNELATLTEKILAVSEHHFPLAEHDRWTMWVARKPVGD